MSTFQTAIGQNSGQAGVVPMSIVIADAGPLIALSRIDKARATETTISASSDYRNHQS
jgi:hypothetical protein